ncbi:MAG: hypothetical protein M5U28_29560 [Sandaracinaceae bacterium]|nr:hypothetical protein [Sandaracinaceae bacterium]
MVMRALAKDRERRWPSAEAFGEALFPYGGVRVPLRDESPSDSFTMEMMRIKAREARHRETHSHAGPAPKPPAPAPAPPPPAPEPHSDADATQRMSHEEAHAMIEELRRLQAEREAQAASVDILIDVAPPVVRRSLVEAAAAGVPGAPRGGRHPARAPPGRLLQRPRGAGDPALRGATVRRARAQAGARRHAGGRAPALRAGDRPRELGRPRRRGRARRAHRRAPRTERSAPRRGGRAGRGGGRVRSMSELRPPAPPPELLVAEMPSIFKQVVRGIDCEVRRVGRGYGRLELVERGEPSLTLAVGTIGFLSRSLERFGADDVEVNLLSARALEDPQTLIDISWFA